MCHDVCVRSACNTDSIITQAEVVLVLWLIIFHIWQEACLNLYHETFYLT